MPGPTPIGVTNRIHQPYTVASLLHHANLYCNLTTGGTGPSGLQTVPNIGWAAVNLEDAVDAFLTAISSSFAVATAAFGGTEIDIYGSGAWIPIYNYSSTVVPTGTGTNEPASESTYFFYTPIVGSGRRLKLPFKLHENMSVSPQRHTTLGACTAPEQAIVNAFAHPSVSHDPGAWVRQKGGAHIDVWLALTIGENRRDRRRRGLL